MEKKHSLGLSFDSHESLQKRALSVTKFKPNSNSNAAKFNHKCKAYIDTKPIFSNGINSLQHSLTSQHKLEKANNVGYMLNTNNSNIQPNKKHHGKYPSKDWIKAYAGGNGAISNSFTIATTTSQGARNIQSFKNQKPQNSYADIRNKSNLLLLEDSYSLNMTNPISLLKDQKPDITIKTSSTSHILTDSVIRKEDVRKAFQKIESEFFINLKSATTYEKIMSACDKCLDDIGKEELPLINVFKEIKKQHANCVTLKTNSIRNELNIILKSNEHITKLLKTTENEKQALIKEVKANQKYIESQQLQIKELKSQLDNDNLKELFRFKEGYMKLKEANKKLHGTVIAINAENNILKQKLNSLLSMMNEYKGLHESELISEDNENRKVPPLDFSKLQKQSYSYIPMVKKSKHTHHSMSSSLNEEEENNSEDPSIKIIVNKIESN